MIDVESVLLRRSDNIKLTLENLLQIVEKEMRNASAEAGFLIDLVPNLRNIERYVFGVPGLVLILANAEVPLPQQQQQ